MPPRHPSDAAGACLVAFIGLAVYLGAIGNGFTLDDLQLGLHVDRAWRWPGWRPFFTREYYDLVPELSYRPLPTLSYYLDFLVLAGGDQARRAAAHHLVGVLIHAANAAMTYLLLRRVSMDAWGALVGAAAFAAHPAASEAVCGIGFREDLMALGFTLAALLFRERALGSSGRAIVSSGSSGSSGDTTIISAAPTVPVGQFRGHHTAVPGAVPGTPYLTPPVSGMSEVAPRCPIEISVVSPELPGLWWAAMLMCGAGALLSKESAVVLPVAALLVDGLAGGPADRRGRRMSAAALAGLALLFLALRLGPMRRDLEVALPLWSGDRLHAFLGACNILVQYVRLAAVPLGLNVEHTPPTGQALSPFWTVAAPAFVAAVVVLAALWWQRWRRAAFGLAWFGLWLLPVCHIVPIANPMAERFMYASLVGLAAGVGVLVGGRPAGALLVAALAALAVLRVPDWRDQRTLHLAAARWNPAAARSVTSLGLAYLEMSPPGEGQGLAGLTEIECRRALAADTKEHLALYMLGNLGNHRAEESRRLGMAERARAEYLSARDRLRAALTLLLREPHFPWTAAQYRDELGVSYWALGDLSRAWTQFSVAARLDPANRVIRGHRDMAEDFLRRKGLLPSANGALPRPGL